MVTVRSSLTQPCPIKVRLFNCFFEAACTIILLRLYPQNHCSGSQSTIYVGVGVGVVLLLVLAVIVYCCIKRPCIRPTSKYIVGSPHDQGNIPTTPPKDVEDRPDQGNIPTTPPKDVEDPLDQGNRRTSEYNNRPKDVKLLLMLYLLILCL